MDRINGVPIYRGTNLSPAESAALDELINKADRIVRGRRGNVSCWCGARVINGHHCENGHMQNRCLVLS